jgi:hypothetical protein
MQPLLKFEILNQYGSHALLVSMEESHIVLEPSEIDALIERLSGYRSEMKPAVPEAPSKSHQYVIETNPSWHAQANPVHDGAVVLMRHTGFGWTAFAIPQTSLRRLIETVSTYAGGKHESGLTQ